ncbi:MAG: SH3 domain-containing protein [Burkholderiaceae bacterium]
MNNLKRCALWALLFSLGACDVVNEKIDAADEAANRMVGKLDNSELNQGINNSLNSVGEKATGFIPEAVRPPAERLGADESPVTGDVPNPEATTPINAGVSEQTDETPVEQAESIPANGTETGADTASASTATNAEAPLVGSGDESARSSGASAPGMPDPASANQAAPPPVALAPDSAAVRAAERELARAAAGPGPELPPDLVAMSIAGVTLKRVNIRLGPGTEHDVLDTVDEGTPLRIAGQTSNDWLLVERNGLPFGFILASLVRTAQ